MPNRACQYCGALRHNKASNRFCSRRCAGLARRVAPPSCARCGAVRSQKNASYCGYVCAAAARSNARPSCPRCGATVKTYRNKYCSRACQGRARSVPEPKWTHPSRIAERREHHTAWRRKNADHVRRKGVEWAKQNQETIRESRRAYMARHPERIVEQRAKRRTALVTRLPVGTWERIKHQAGYACLACGAREPSIRLTMDHVIPLSRGGAHVAGNIQPLCQPCNSSKNAKTIDYRIARSMGGGA